MFQQVCQNCLPRVHREPMKKSFLKKVIKIVFFVFWATIYNIIVFFGSGLSRKSDFQVSTGRTQKRIFLFFLSLLYLQLNFWPFDQNFGAVCQVFNVCFLWNHERNWIFLGKVNTLLVVIGHWVEVCFWTLGGRNSGKMSKLRSIRPEKRFEERVFVQHSYNF